MIPTGVSLYHGTHLDTIPIESDCQWTAMDPENSIIFCRGVDGNSWHLMLVAMRPLKVSYYISTETVLSEGTLDIEGVIIWGRTTTRSAFQRKTPSHRSMWVGSMGGSSSSESTI